MTLVQKLLKTDSGEFSKKRVKKIESEMLSEILGEKTLIAVQSIDPQEILDLSEIALDDEGNPIAGKTLEANSLIAAAAVVDPPLKDKDLMKHIGTATPAELALKLFKGEVNTIAEKANRMAGFGLGVKEVDEEIKN